MRLEAAILVIQAKAKENRCVNLKIAISGLLFYRQAWVMDIKRRVDKVHDLVHKVKSNYEVSNAEGPELNNTHTKPAMVTGIEALKYSIKQDNCN